jgi:hypothetical protein
VTKARRTIQARRHGTVFKHTTISVFKHADRQTDRQTCTQATRSKHTVISHGVQEHSHGTAMAQYSSPLCSDLVSAHSPGRIQARSQDAVFNINHSHRHPDIMQSTHTHTYTQARIKDQISVQARRHGTVFKHAGMKAHLGATRCTEEADLPARDDESGRGTAQGQCEDQAQAKGIKALMVSRVKDDGDQGTSRIRRIKSARPRSADGTREQRVTRHADPGARGSVIEAREGTSSAMPSCATGTPQR